jgi:hypothetical protein
MIVYEFKIKGSNKRYMTAFSPLEINELYCFDAEFHGESCVISVKEVNYKSFMAFCI